MNNLASLLDATTDKYGKRTAIVFDHRRLSYSELQAMANLVANLLRSRGVGRGDRVAVSCPNTPWFTALYFGILKAGCAVIPLNVLLKAREVGYHLDDAGVRAYFCFEGSPALHTGIEGRAGFDNSACEHFFLITTGDEAHDPTLADAETLTGGLADQPTEFDTVEVDPEETAVILYTSGTTGRPKGAELRHRNMIENARATGGLFDADSALPDTYLCVLPLFHSFGQTITQNCAIGYGGTMVMLPRFEARAALTLMLREKVTVFAGVPTMYWSLLGCLDEIDEVGTLARQLRLAVSGGAPLPGEVHRQVEHRLDVTVLEGYGLSETSPLASFSRPGEPARIGSIGAPIPGVEMRLLRGDSWDEVSDDPEAIGEIAIKGHNVMKGYFGRPDETAEVLRDGWFRTGDLARRDEDGWYYIVDRAKDLIIRNGFNVYPRELEEVLMTHPAISLAAVVGVPHPATGEEIKAFVILTPGATATSEEIVAWGREQLAPYKYPRHIEVVTSLPMTATGKVLKRELLHQA